MKLLLLTLLLLYSTVASATLVPGVNSVIQGGYGENLAVPAVTSPITNLSTRVMLTTAHNSDTSNNFYMFVSTGNAGPAQYQVTSGKVLYCNSVTHQESEAKYYIFGYGTAALGSNNTGTAPTGVQYYSTGTTANPGGILMSSGGANTPKQLPFFIKFPASSYPFVKVSSTGAQQFQLVLDCIEQ